MEEHKLLLIEGFHKQQELYATETNAMESVIGKWDRINKILLTFTQKAVVEGEFSSYHTTFKSVFEKLASKDEFLHDCESWVENCILHHPEHLSKLEGFVHFIH